MMMIADAPVLARSSVADLALAQFMVEAGLGMVDVIPTGVTFLVDVILTVGVVLSVDAILTALEESIEVGSNTETRSLTF